MLINLQRRRDDPTEQNLLSTDLTTRRSRKSSHLRKSKPRPRKNLLQREKLHPRRRDQRDPLTARMRSWYWTALRRAASQLDADKEPPKNKFKTANSSGKANKNTPTKMLARKNSVLMCASSLMTIRNSVIRSVTNYSERTSKKP